MTIESALEEWCEKVRHEHPNALAYRAGVTWDTARSMWDEDEETPDNARLRTSVGRSELLRVAGDVAHVVEEIAPDVDAWQDVERLAQGVYRDAIQDRVEANWGTWGLWQMFADLELWRHDACELIGGGETVTLQTGTAAGLAELPRRVIGIVLGELIGALLQEAAKVVANVEGEKIDDED